MTIVICDLNDIICVSINNNIYLLRYIEKRVKSFHEDYKDNIFMRI